MAILIETDMGYIALALMVLIGNGVTYSQGFNVTHTDVDFTTMRTNSDEVLMAYSDKKHLVAGIVAMCLLVLLCMLCFWVGCICVRRRKRKRELAKKETKLTVLQKNKRGKEWYSRNDAGRGEEVPKSDNTAESDAKLDDGDVPLVDKGGLQAAGPRELQTANEDSCSVDIEGVKYHRIEGEKEAPGEENDPLMSGTATEKEKQIFQNHDTGGNFGDTMV